MKLENLKEETRLIVAFAMAVIIIMLFGLPRGQQVQEKPQESAPVEERQRRVDTSPIVEREVEREVERIGLPVIDRTGDIQKFIGSRYILDIETSGGYVNTIGVKDYTRTGESSLLLSGNSLLFMDFPENMILWKDTDYVFNYQDDKIFLQGSPAEGIVVNKDILTPSANHTFNASIEIHNNGYEDINLSNYRVYTGSIDTGKVGRDRAFITPEITVNTGADILTNNVLKIKENQLYNNAYWIGLKENYALILVRSDKAAKAFISKDNDILTFGFIYDEISIGPGMSHELEFSFYAGPSDYFIASKEVSEDVFGGGIFASLGRILFRALAFIQMFIPNWGWSIIILTFIVKILFYPLSRKSLKSMKAMQKLRPYMQDIQKKYKDNPQQMQKELMNIYREYKINPLGGCIPMLMQFPIFIGFFLALRNSVHLRGASFGLWITDLSLPDAIGQIGDFNLNLLPIVMAATSLWQQKLTPQEPSQKALTVMMPVMFLFIFYNFSSGLLLYWITMNIAGLVEQYFVHKK